MPIRYKVDVMAKLRDAGYTTYRLRKEKLLGEATIQLLRHSKPVSWENMTTLCELLKCQPGDLLVHVPEEAGEDDKN